MEEVVPRCKACVEKLKADGCSVQLRNDSDEYGIVEISVYGRSVSTDEKEPLASIAFKQEMPSRLRIDTTKREGGYHGSSAEVGTEIAIKLVTWELGRFLKRFEK